MKRIFILGNRSLLLQCDTMTQQTKKNLKCVLISRLFSLNTSLLPSPYYKYRRKTFKNAYFGHIQIVTVKNEHLVWSSLRVWNDKVHSVSRLWNFPLAPLIHSRALTMFSLVFSRFPCHSKVESKNALYQRNYIKQRAPMTHERFMAWRMSLRCSLIVIYTYNFFFHLVFIFGGTVCYKVCWCSISSMNTSLEHTTTNSSIKQRIRRKSNRTVSKLFVLSPIVPHLFGFFLLFRWQSQFNIFWLPI